MKADSILSAVNSVTKKWTKQRKAEERGRARSRREALTYTRRVTIKDAAFEVMEKAYMKASTDNTLPAAARQIMYAGRRQILKRTGRTALDDQYSTQTLLPQYMADWRFREKAATWDVTYDARGHFAEPHTKLIVPIGTIDVRNYVAAVVDHAAKNLEAKNFHCDSKFPTRGPEHRFAAVMFVEKGGFLPLFQATNLAERDDLAIMSTKGMPVVACRRLADELCGRHGIPLLVLHDFDKAGFSILGTLQDVDHDYRFDDYGFEARGKRYEFTHDIEVIDFGLRLGDVKKHRLESEGVTYRSDPSDNLKEMVHRQRRLSSSAARTTRGIRGVNASN